MRPERVFYFRLALALGFPHPDEMLKALTCAQVLEWMEYYAIEPWGEPTNWYRSGVLAALIANIHRVKNAPPFKPADFMPKAPQAKEPERPQTVEEQAAILKQIAAANKGPKKRKR